MAKKEFNKKVFMGKFLAILILGIVLGISYLFSAQIESFLGIGKKASGFATATELQDSDLTVHYLDVGQGDSTLILLPDETVMLIDAGTSSEGKNVVSYIKDLGISTIDYFIVTHSDSDHCGGAFRILDEFVVKNIYRPFQIAVDDNGKAIKDDKGNLIEELGYYLDVYSNISKVDTDTYGKFIEYVYDEAEESDANVIVSHDGLTIHSKDVSKPFSFEFFAPKVISTISVDTMKAPHTTGFPVKTYTGSDAHVKNSSSPIMLLEYNEKSFLFSGDATDDVELDFVNSLEFDLDEKQRFIDVDVFQAGHHGSNTSNTEELLKLTTPDYVVVSCGEGNDYGHPHSEFIDRVNDYSHSTDDYLLRTDISENIVFGFNTEGKLVYAAVAGGQGVTIYWYQIAIGLFVVLSITIICVKVTKNKKATAKRFVKKTKQVSKVYKNR